MLLHSLDKRREILRVAQLDPHHRGTAFARVFLGILEVRDVVVWAEHPLKKFAQRARPLREAQDEIMLQPLVELRALLDVFHAGDVVVAAADDADDVLAADIIFYIFKRGD